MYHGYNTLDEAIHVVKTMIAQLSPLALDFEKAVLEKVIQKLEEAKHDYECHCRDMSA